MNRLGSGLKVGVAFAVALAGVLGQGSAIAQDASAAALEEIVITARKVEESLQDAPIAVSAFTDAGITERGIVDVNSLATFSPGLSFSQAFGRQNDRPVIRGQGNVLANVQFGVESGTAYFIDGVYYNGDIQAIDFDSLQRVEVIKGPQSALYGRNTYAGAINFITRDPRMDAWGGYANATAAESDEYKVAVSLDGPVWSDKLAMRIGGRFNTYDGEYVNQATGATVGDEEDWSVNATFLFTPTDDLSVRLFTNHRRQDDGPLALFLQGGEENNCAPGFRSIGYRGVSSVTGMATTTPVFGQFAPDGNPNQYYCGTIAAQPDGIWLNTDAIGPTSTFPNNGFADGTAFDGVEAHETFSSLGIDWDMGGSGWTLRALGGYRHNYDRFGTDSDHSEAFVLLGPPGVAEPLFANTNRNDRREWSSELKVLTPQERRVRGLLGAYYYYIDDQERDLTFASPEFGTLNGGNITGVKNEAVFGSVAFDVTEQFTVGAEVRYFEETKDRTEIGATGLVTVEQEATFRDTTPRVTLDYRLTDDLLIYGIYAQGVRPGGVNGSAGQATGRPSYEPETSENFELGLKSTWLDGRLRVNASAYFIDAEDVQVTQAIPGGGAGAVTSIAVNQAKAETIGGEIEVTAALTDYLTGTATFAYVDPEFQEGCDDFEFVLNSGGIAYNPATDFGSPLCDISGNRLPLTPETQGSLLLTYERPVADDMSFLVSGTYSYEGSKFVQVHNLAETGDTHLLGLRVGLSGDQWSFIAFGRNLTDEDTIPLATRWFDLRYGGCTTGGACRGLAGTAPANADRGSPRAFFGALRKGRTFGFEVRYKF